MTAYTESDKYREDLRRAVRKYQAEKQDTITVRVPKGKKEKYYKVAEKAGVPFRQFFIDLMEKAVSEQDKGV